MFPFLDSVDLRDLSSISNKPTVYNEIRRTFPHSHRPSILAPLLQFPNPINHGQHLHRITRTQKMCIVPWRGPKPTAVRLARKHKFYCFISRQCVGAVKKVQSIETPVETGHSEVFGEPVFELVFTLRDVSRDRGAGGGDEQCRGFGCILRAVLWRVGVHLEGHSLQHGQGLIQETS
jgi:hypothetical protein